MTDRQLAHNADQLRMLADLYQTAEDVIRRQTATIDGYPHGGERVGSRGTSDLTPTEAAVEQRRQLNADLEDLRAGRHLIDVTVNDMTKSCHAILRRRLTGVTEPPRCNCLGRDGYETWGSTSCHAFSENKNGGPCDTHARAERRWRKTEGLPDRRRAA